VNWDAIGAIGEVLGAVGVIITLVYLSVQLRQNTRAMRGQTHGTRTTHIIEMNTVLMDSQWYWEVLEKLAERLPGRTSPLGGNTEATVEDWKEAPASLSFAERGRFTMVAVTQWHYLQNQALQAERGIDASSMGVEPLVESQANMYEALGISSIGNSRINEIVATRVSHR
jgi:hypothetical protein